MSKFGSAIFNRLVIIIPYVWLTVFFLAPFFIVLRISLSETAIAMPPYLPVFNLADGISGIFEKIGQLSTANYEFLAQRCALHQCLSFQFADCRRLDHRDTDDRLSHRL